MLLTTPWLAAKHFHRDHSKLMQPDQRHWNNGPLTVLHDPNVGWSIGYIRYDGFGKMWDILHYGKTEEEIQLLVDEELAKRNGLKAVVEVRGTRHYVALDEVFFAYNGLGLSHADKDGANTICREVVGWNYNPVTGEPLKKLDPILSY